MDQCNRRIFRDRRKKTTSALSRFALWGRRRTFRRNIDQQKGGYVDHYNALIFFFLISAVALNILDAFITIVILDLGGWEVNPIVRSAIEVYGDKFWVWKFVIVSACVVFLCLHCKFRRAKLAIVSLNIFYLFVVFFNVLQIILRWTSESFFIKDRVRNGSVFFCLFPLIIINSQTSSPLKISRCYPQPPFSLLPSCNRVSISFFSNIRFHIEIKSRKGFSHFRRK